MFKTIKNSDVYFIVALVPIKNYHKIVRCVTSTIKFNNAYSYVNVIRR